MTAPPSAIVELENVSFRYGSNASPLAVEQISIQVFPNDFLGLIGPNGGGKTTVLKLILGLIKPEIGTVRVLGQLPLVVRHRIGYVPQHARIDCSVPANVLDVVLMGRLARSGWGPRFGPEHREAAMAALELTQSDHLAKRTIASLSGGQRQRVLIARALAANARLLLLDEPTCGVDEQMERSFTDLLHRLTDKLPVVMASHDIAFVSTHMKRVACLNRKLTCHSASEISRGIIGQMYDGKVTAVLHDNECPLHDPGCGHGCDPHEAPLSERTSA